MLKPKIHGCVGRERQSFEELKEFIQNFKLYQRIIHNFVWDHTVQAGQTKNNE